MQVQHYSMHITRTKEAITPTYDHAASQQLSPASWLMLPARLTRRPACNTCAGCCAAALLMLCMHTGFCEGPDDVIKRFAQRCAFEDARRQSPCRICLLCRATAILMP